MKLFRMRSLGMFGIGFLAGSAAGRGPWEKTQESMGQLKDKVAGANGSSMQGIDGQRAQTSPQMTEI
jgi:hypothetical protein